MKTAPQIDFTEVQPLGSGSIQIVEEREFGRWAIVLDGVRRGYRSTQASADRDAHTIYLALAPDGGCPVCLRPIRPSAGGRLPAHAQPRLHGTEPRECPGAGLRAVGQ